MKKITLFAVFFILLTSCKGKEITHVEAKDRINEILAYHNVEDGVVSESPNIYVESENVTKGPEEEVNLKYVGGVDYKNNVFYFAGNIESSEEEYELYVGEYKDRLTYVDVIQKEYYYVDDKYFNEAIKNLDFYEILNLYFDYSILEAYLDFELTEGENLKFYSSGEGSLVIEGSATIEIGESNKMEMYLYYGFKNYMIDMVEVQVLTYENDNQINSIYSKTVYTYGKTLKMPRINNYTNKS